MCTCMWNICDLDHKSMKSISLGSQYSTELNVITSSVCSKLIMTDQPMALVGMKISMRSLASLYFFLFIKFPSVQHEEQDFYHHTISHSSIT